MNGGVRSRISKWSIHSRTNFNGRGRVIRQGAEEIPENDRRKMIGLRTGTATAGKGMMNVEYGIAIYEQ